MENITNFFANLQKIMSQPLNSSLFNLFSLFESKEEQIALNTPQQNIIAQKVLKFANFNTLYRIPQLLQDNPQLHERYMAIKKNQFYFYHNMDASMTKDEYIQEKFTVYSLITDWARPYYYRGDSKISNPLYDYLKQRRSVTTYIQPSSVIVSEKLIGRPLMGIIQPLPLDATKEEIWAVCGVNYYTLDNLLIENPALHERYINMMKMRYYYFNGLNTALPDDEYDKMKRCVISEILEWSAANIVCKKQSITDTERDFLISLTQTRTFIYRGTESSSW
jgi:hypothetical protein